jgi:hypothetical protein
VESLGKPLGEVVDYLACLALFILKYLLNACMWQAQGKTSTYKEV